MIKATSGVRANTGSSTSPSATTTRPDNSTDPVSYLELPGVHLNMRRERRCWFLRGASCFCGCKPQRLHERPMNLSTHFHLEGVNQVCGLYHHKGRSAQTFGLIYALNLALGDWPKSGVCVSHPLCTSLGLSTSRVPVSNEANFCLSSMISGHLSSEPYQVRLERVGFPVEGVDS